MCFLNVFLSFLNDDSGNEPPDEIRPAEEISLPEILAGYEGNNEGKRQLIHQ